MKASNRTGIEEIPGVLAFGTSCLASGGLNVLQVMSCRRDTILVLEERDFMEAFRLLKRAMA